MLRIWLLLICLVVFNIEGRAQVKIKLFSDYSLQSVSVTVTEGRYEILKSNGENIGLSKNDRITITSLNGLLTVKPDSAGGFNDSIITLKGETGKDVFALVIPGKKLVKRNYSGDLTCSAGKRSIVILNTCPSEDYISGVVLAEGGNKQNIEYYKAQSILARTYMFKYIEDNFGESDFLTDNTDCQVFFGITSDPAILKAAVLTKGQVILDRDKTVIECAFHSNCGGVTCSSGDVWLSHKPYLKSVTDPFCQNSKNAKWKKSISLDRWVNYVRKSGYIGKTEDPSVFSFSGQSRSGSYLIGSFALPFTRIRTEMHLPSAFFTVKLKGDSVVLNGRGFGHGVGLCQEGAMMMARQGYTYTQIINFYYNGVIITDISKAPVLPQLKGLRASYARDYVAKSENKVALIRSEDIFMQASR